VLYPLSYGGQNSRGASRELEKKITSAFTEPCVLAAPGYRSQTAR
jgi:hypothetical protein